MNLAATFDAITVEQLRATKSLKWCLPDQAIGAFVAEMDFGTSPVVAAALRKELDRGSFGYAPPNLVEQTGAATAERLRAVHGWQVDPADVRVTPEVILVLDQVIASTTDPGTPVVVPTPAYMNFFTAIRRQGREAIEVPMIRDDRGHWTLDLPGIAAAIERSGAQLVILCNPHNPTGRVFTREELEAFSHMVEGAGVRVFADEIWAPIVFEGHRHIPYASLSETTAAHTVTAVSATKGWNIAGLKCAQAVLTSDVDREAWSRMPTPLSDRTPSMGMAGTIAAYRDGSRWIDEVTAYLADCTSMVADMIGEGLPAAVVSRPEGTYVNWVDLTALDLPCPAVEFIQREARVVPTDGRSCGTVGEGHIRIIAAMPRPILRAAMSRTIQALRPREAPGPGPALDAPR